MRWTFQVEDDALLCAVVGVEVVLVGIAPAVPPNMPQLVANFGALDLHDLGPHVSKHRGAERAGNDLGQIEDPDAVKRRADFCGAHSIWPRSSDCLTTMASRLAPRLRCNCRFMLSLLHFRHRIRLAT